MWNPKSLLCIESWNFEIEVDAAGFLLGQKLWKKNCNSGCDGGGICNMELAQCQCAVGFSGFWDLYFTALIDIAMSRPGYPWLGSAAACMWANLVKKRKCKQAGGRWTLREWMSSVTLWPMGIVPWAPPIQFFTTSSRGSFAEMSHSGTFILVHVPLHRVCVIIFTLHSWRCMVIAGGRARLQNTSLSGM